MNTSWTAYRAFHFTKAWGFCVMSSWAQTLTLLLLSHFCGLTLVNLAVTNICYLWVRKNNKAQTHISTYALLPVQNRIKNELVGCEHTAAVMRTDNDLFSAARPTRHTAHRPVCLTHVNGDCIHVSNNVIIPKSAWWVLSPLTTDHRLIVRRWLLGWPDPSSVK